MILMLCKSMACKKQYFITVGFTAPSADLPPLTWSADFKHYTSMENDHLAKGIFLSEKQDENFGLHKINIWAEI